MRVNDSKPIKRIDFVYYAISNFVKGTRIFTFFMSHEKVRDQSPTEWGFAFPRGYSSSPPIACSAGSSAT